MRVRYAGSLALLLVAGCQSSPDPALPRGAAAYAVIPPPEADTEVHAYEIGPLDTLRVTVFQEPDLSFAEIPVDASGTLALPLVGTITAAGKTAAELSGEIANRLNADYLVDAQVSVAVVSSASQHVTVEGNVVQPGVYEINGSSTLLQALAIARSPTPVAKLDQVVVFRMVDGRRMGAVFDVNAIREGRAPDPELLGGDVVVVGFSFIKGAFRDFLKAAPFFNVFRYF